LKDNGILPSKRLLATERYPRFERRPKDSGRNPVKELDDKSNWRRSVSWPSVAGIEPSKLFPEMMIVCSAERLPTYGDSVPL
jgi:hypothetical protein